MTITNGSRLGPYEIVAPLGAGGMGEVYRARDTRLGRDVAIKVLPQHLAVTIESRARFEREARAVAALNHPHICVLHDVGREKDTDYLVMELVEGETLAARLERGALPIEETLELGLQIAAALERAHRAGIVHRDLKPGNVMLTKTGVKLMDFGLARAVEGGGAASWLTQSPTIVQPLTAEGAIVGTFQYMAPEQLEGREADTRGDIWALGCALYEMATGTHAFDGASRASLIGAVMRAQPRPMVELQPLTPPAFERAVKQCLAKDPEERWQTAGDLRRELAWIRESGGQTNVPVATRAARGSPWAWRVATGVLALVALGAVLLPRSPRREAVPAVRLSVMPPKGGWFSFNPPLLAPPALAPDGTQIVFGAIDSLGRHSLWIQAFDEFEPKPLPGTQGGFLPFWSPDGRFIGFFAGTRLKRIDVSGGSPQELVDCARLVPEGGSAGPRGGAWSRNGVLLFAPSPNAGLFRISANGGAAVQVTYPDTALADISHRFPVFLPDGDHFLFLVHSNARGIRESSCGIHVGSLGSEKIRRLTPDLSNVAWSPSGHLIFVRDGALVAQRFDLRRLDVSGAPVTVAEKLQYAQAASLGVFTASASGALAYRSTAGLSRRRLVWLARSGSPIDTVGAWLDNTVRLSPDARRAAVITTDAEGGSDVWVIDAVRKTGTRFVTWPSDEYGPVWSPDGSRLLFASDSTGTDRMYVRPLDASSEPERFGDGRSPRPGGLPRTEAMDWSKDGRWVAFWCGSPRTLVQGGNRAGRALTVSEIWVRSEPDGRTTRVLGGDAMYDQARFSADAKWLAYVSDESGRQEVYVRSFPVFGGRWQVSAGGGFDPHWRSDGREIVYRTPTNDLIAVDLNSVGGLNVGVPRKLFAITGDAFWDATADHERFLVAMSADERSTNPVRVVLGWAGEQRPRR